MAFPEKIYGRCPLGFNLAPSDDTGDDLSTTLMDEGEEKPLYWSNYHQKYVCKMHLERVQDLIDDDKFHERDQEQEKKRQSMGFVKTDTYEL